MPRTTVSYARLAQLQYDAYLIEEPCGSRLDCRNLLCIPRSRIETMMGSAALDLATISGILHAVTSSTILNHAYPCCVHGGACCPSYPRGASCCTQWRVHEWRDAQNLTNRYTSRERIIAERSALGSWWTHEGGFAPARMMLIEQWGMKVAADYKFLSQQSARARP